ncbi:MAG: response regulator [Wenzhouxiangella sp.]|nr:response regulator [Wenzhouxiangella sp.]
MKRLACALLLASVNAWATDPGVEWVVRHFTTANGLPVSSAGAARIDLDGFVWLATHDGLARYDGRRFEVFDMADRPAMDSNRIAGLFTNDQGRLHALTSSGSLLGVRANRIERLVVDPNEPDAATLHVQESPFCITQQHGLFCRDDQGDFQLTTAIKPAFAVRHALRVPDHGTWIINQSGQTWWQPDNGPAREVLPGLDGEITSTAMPMADGSVLIPQLDRLTQAFSSGRTETHLLPDQEQGKGPELTSVNAGQDLNVWVGTSRALYRLDTASGDWSRVHTRAPEGLSAGWTMADGSAWTSQGGALFRNGLELLGSDGLIEDIFTTGDDLVWISTLRDGVYALSRPRVSVIDRRHGLDSENIYGVALDPEGRLWIGSLGGEIQVVAGATIGRYGIQQGLPGENPWAVMVAPDGTVYVATYQPGLHVLFPGSEKFVAVALPDGLANAQLRALSIGLDGQLWVGGQSGVWRQDGEQWHRYCRQQLDGIRVLHIHHADNDIRWYGTARGLWREDTTECRAVAADQLGDYEIRHLHEDAGGVLWASTQGHGLVRIAASTDRSPDRPEVTRIGRRQGLPSNSLHAIAEDQAGNFWANSNQGVFRLNRQELEQFLAEPASLLSPLVLTRADGLRDLEGNGGVQPAVAVDQHGRIYFPSQSGLINIHPERLAVRTRAPAAVIDTLLAGGVEQDIHEEVRLPLGRRNILLRFAAADLRGSPDRFRYRLNATGLGGEEAGWNEIIGQNSTSFADISPGHYRFEVVAGNNDGSWGTQAAVLDFSVPAFWWETGLFRWSVLVLLLLGMGGLAHYRIQSLRRRAIELNREVDLRTRELAEEKSLVEQTLAQLANAHESLEQTHNEIARRNRKLATQADRLQELDDFRKRLLANVSHELRTPLMLIDLPLSEMDEKADGQPDRWDESERRNLKLARRQTERLTELVSQLVTLVQAESGQLELKVSRIDLGALIDELIQAYQPLARQQDIELESSLPGRRQTLAFADREQLTTALGNLIDNAIKHSPEGALIQIGQQVDSNESSVRITVTDQGHGFDPAVASRLFERFFRAETGPKAGREGLGIGLALAREIVELHGGRIGAESHRGEGASFWIELPLGGSHIALTDLALDQAETEPVATAETRPDSGQQRLALVEDHPELAGYLRDRLQEFLPVSLFTTAEAALSEINRQPFGLLLSDVMLPGISGIELCRQVRQHPDLAALPVILVSAKAADSDRESALAAGAHDYLVKPFSFDELLTAIGSAWPAVRPILQGASTTHVVDPLMLAATDHLIDPEFGVEDWARLVHLSPRQLRRRVAELCGQSPLVWLREQRLLRVRQLISSGQCKTLAEAGARSGLDNPTYLYRLYRARFGESSGKD